MSDEIKEIEVRKEELAQTDESERARENLCFVPRADIYETPDQVVVVADIPGAKAEDMDITLDKNILTINCLVDPDYPEGYHLTFGEYEIGDYQRKFKLSDEIDREKIEAVVKDGVLRLYLPKAGPAKVKKIDVTTA